MSVTIKNLENFKSLSSRSIFFLFTQRHCDAKAVVMKVASSVVDDYTNLVPASLPLLEALTAHSPLMASQILIVLTCIYLPTSGRSE